MCISLRFWDTWRAALFLLSTVLICFSSGNLSARVNVDSLRLVWQDESLEDSSRFEALKDMIRHFRLGNPDSTRHYAEIMLEVSTKKGIETDQIHALLELGTIYTKQNNYPEAHDFYQEALHLSRTLNNQESIARVSGNMGLLHMYQAQLDSAQYYFQRALSIGNILQNEEITATFYGNMGIIKRRIGELDSAIFYYTKSIPVLKRINQKASAGGMYINISNIYGKQGKLDLAYEYALQGKRLCEEAGAKEFIAKALKRLGSISEQKGDTQLAIDYILQAAQIREELHQYKGAAAFLNDVAWIYKRQGQYKEAIGIYQKNIHIFEKFNSKNGQAATYINIGNLYSTLIDDEKALQFFQKGIDICKSNDKNVGLQEYESNGLNNIGKLFRRQKKYDKALDYYFQSLAIREKLGIPGKIASSLSSIGIVYRYKKEFHLAIQYHEKALAIAQEIGKKSTIASALNSIGSLYKVQNDHAKAIEYKSRALLLYQQIGNVQNVKTASKSLYQSYKTLNQSRRALDMYELYIEMKDSLAREENQRAIIQFEYQEKALKDSLAFVQEQTDLTLAYQNNLAKRNYLLIGGSVFALFLLIFFRYRQRITIRKKEADARHLQEIDQLKTRLYTNITHEFRTPLTVIQGMAKKVLEKPDKWLKQGTGMIERNSVQLLNLVNQMLDLSKLESGKLQLQAVQADIIPFLYYVAEPFQAMAESKGISLHIQQDVDKLTMDFDPDRMTEIISNLLSNAIKFTPIGGRIDIQALSDKDAFMLIIRDTGIGIPEDKLPHVFDRFYQADDSPTLSGEGSGIGLALCKELVQLMGGRIQVSSQPGEGTEFTITLPISQQAMVAELPLMEVNTAAPSNALLPAILPEENQLLSDLPQILLIEDNADVVSYLSSCLEANYRISIARNGQEGIEKALELVPDLIISDVMMPEKDGFEVCYTLKQDIRTSHVPIIMLTAKADVDSKLTGLRRGADAYLSKPFHEEELFIRIQNLLEVRTTLQDRYRSIADELDAASTAEIEKEDVFIQEVRQVVMSQLSNYQLDVPTLCKELGMARTPLHNKLKALTGMSTTEFVRFVRLTHAQELLRETDMHVSEIAYATGFQNHTYFSRKFRELVGETPKAWREGT